MKIEESKGRDATDVCRCGHLRYSACTKVLGTRGHGCPRSGTARLSGEHSYKMTFQYLHGTMRVHTNMMKAYLEVPAKLVSSVAAICDRRGFSNKLADFRRPQTAATGRLFLLAAGWFFLTAVSGFSANAPDAASKPEARSFKDCLLPAPKHGGFAMDDYFLWCSSVIKVGDTYQMFASRWPAQYGMGGWTKYSECVRATSTNLYGPYLFQEVVLQKRADNWDNSRVHNVKIVKAGDKFVLYYINSANQTGYAVADAVTGPWTRQDKYVIKASNPAILVRPDLSVYVFCRLRDSSDVNRGVAFTAPSYQGPYTAVANGGNLLPNGAELEDPTIWWANNQYNLLLNDWKGKATGTFKAGAQYFSKDGMHYTLMTREPVFTKTVPYDDGTSETFSRRERPFVYVNEKGEVVALFTACLPKEGPARVVVQPVKNYYPEN